MTRRPISKATETAVLVKSRRRCCICFGLNRDLKLKSGQLAHLNQRNDDNRKDNLAYLRLDHHDEYDSRTSQRKGLTEAEVRANRDELYERLAEYLVGLEADGGNLRGATTSYRGLAMALNRRPFRRGFALGRDQKRHDASEADRSRLRLSIDPREDIQKTFGTIDAPTLGERLAGPERSPS